MSDNPSVSVIIPARDAPDILPMALKSIELQTYSNIVEVIVAAADPETAAAAVGAGATKVIDNPTGSTAAGLNRAIAESTGVIIVRCDAHAELPPDYVKQAVLTMGRTNADNVGGMQVPVGNTEWEQAIAAAMRSPVGAGNARYRIGGQEGPAETVYLGVFKRETLEELGGFDESFTRTQDYELNHRIRATGGLVWFDPELTVSYRPRGSLVALARQYRQYGRAKRQFNRKHPRALQPRQLVPPLLVLLLFISLVTSVIVTWAALIPIGYALGLIVASMGSSGSTVRTAAALATMHISWGWGFLSG